MPVEVRAGKCGITPLAAMRRMLKKPKPTTPKPTAAAATADAVRTAATRKAATATAAATTRPQPFQWPNRRKNAHRRKKPLLPHLLPPCPKFKRKNAKAATTAAANATRNATKPQKPLWLKPWPLRQPSSLPLPNPQRKNAADAIRSGAAEIRATATATAAATRNATFRQPPKSSSI